MHQAYLDKSLTLYLGAGVSVANGLPTWPQLVLAMYFRLMDEKQTSSHRRPFANYLFAIAEWHLERRREPLEITARKVRRLYEEEQRDFIAMLRSVLYQGFREPEEPEYYPPAQDPLLAANPTLKAILDLCDSSARSSVQSVITYNYGNLLEYAGGPQLQPVCKSSTAVAQGAIPVYHVHGFVPMDGSGPGSTADEMVFTEEQYHAAYQDLYSWSNLVQIQAMSNFVGLMVGLSMTDPNMRHLLDAVRKLPKRPENYVLLKKRAAYSPTPEDISAIDASAANYLQRFVNSGRKTSATKSTQIKDIIEDLNREDESQQVAVLEGLRVHTIWWTDVAEIPQKIAQIIGGVPTQAAVAAS